MKYRSYAKPSGLIAALILGVALSPASQAIENAGVTVTNNVQIDWTFGGTTPNDTDSSSFVIDLYVVHDVDEDAGAEVTLPATTTADTTANAVSFTLLSSSNDAMRFNLAAGNENTVAPDFASTDDNDLSAFAIYADTDGDGDLSDETAITSVQLENGADATCTTEAVTGARVDVDCNTVVVYVVGLAPTVDDENTNIFLTMTAAGNANETYGVDLTALAQGADVDVGNTYQIVYDEDDDGAGDTDDTAGNAAATANDGVAGAIGAYVVRNATFTIAKTNSIFSDPLGGTTYEVPGSVIEYNLAITFTGTGTATSVSISDTYDATNTTLDGSSNWLTAGAGQTVDVNYTGGTETDFTCDPDNGDAGADGCEAAAGVLTINLGGAAWDPNTTAVTIRYHATIN